MSTATPTPTYQPHPGQQTRFHESQDIFEVLYGGEAGGGKSAAITAESLRQVHHPHYQGIIFRRTNDELEQIKIEARRMFPAAGGTFQEGSNTGIFPSGARVYLRYMQFDGDRFKYQGREFQYIGFDELTHFTENQYTYLFSRCRTAYPGLQCYVRASANPGGVGHAWVKRRFIDQVPADPDRAPVPKSFLGGRDPETGRWEERQVPPGTPFSSSRAFIPASRFDNLTLMRADPNYEGRIRAMSDPLMAEAILTGNWELFAGQFFTRFRPQIHIIDESEAGIKDWWTKIRGLDWGFSAACATEWLALGPKGQVIFYNELYESERSPQWLAEKILKKDAGDAISIAYAGRDTWARNPLTWNKEDTADFMPNSVAAAFMQGGVPLTPANQDRKQGWALFHRLMDWKGELQQDNSWEFEYRPKLYIIRGRCPQLVRQIQAGTRKEHDPEDMPDGEDHALEAARYALMHLHMDSTVEPTAPLSWMEIETQKLLGEYQEGNGLYDYGGRT